MNRPRQVGVTPLTASVFRPSLAMFEVPGTFASGHYAMLEFEDGSGPDEALTNWDKLGREAIGAGKAIGFGVHNRIGDEADVIELYEYAVCGEIIVPQTTGGTQSAEFIECLPVAVQGVPTIDGVTGQVYRDTASWTVLPDIEMVWSPTLLPSVTLAENKVLFRGTGVLSVTSAGTAGDAVGIGVTVLNKGGVTADVKDVRLSCYLRRWNEDVQSRNPNSGG